MKLSRSSTPDMEALAFCVAHRCINHKDLPPLNMNEGNGSSECGGCAAEQFGARLAEQALAIQETDVLFPVLDGYADRLSHHAVLVATLEQARARLNLMSPGAGDFITDVIGV